MGKWITNINGLVGEKYVEKNYSTEEKQALELFHKKYKKIDQDSISTNSYYLIDSYDKKAWDEYYEANPIIRAEQIEKEQGFIAAIDYFEKAARQGHEEAISKIYNAAKDGLSKAQRILSDMYLHGKGVEQNYKLAIYWLKFSADDGDFNSQLEIARIYFEEHGDETSDVLKKEWFNEAYRCVCGITRDEHLHIQSQINNIKNLKFRNIESSSVDNILKSYPYFHNGKWGSVGCEFTAEYKAINAIIDVARHNAREIDYPDQYLQKFYSILNSYSKNPIVTIYLSEFDGSVDISRIYYKWNGVPGTVKKDNFQNIIECLYKKIPAQYDEYLAKPSYYISVLGKHIENNDDMEFYNKYIVNISTHIYPLINSYDQKATHPRQFWIESASPALQYEHGEDIESREGVEVALEWYMLAATRGFELAQLKIKRFAEQGNLKSINKLAEMYYKGMGVDKNYTIAYNWYKIAAEKGHIFSQIRIGDMLLKGQGVEKSKEEAKTWFKKACEAGNSEACDMLKVLDCYK